MRNVELRFLLTVAILKCSALINDWGDEGASMVILASGSAPGKHMRYYLPKS